MSLVDIKDEFAYLLFMESQQSKKEKEHFNSNVYVNPSDDDVLQPRPILLSLLLDLKCTYPEYFQDPLVIYLAIAYMDRVFCCKAAHPQLKKSPALPMACALIAMKV